jgi:hypothetical protein
MEEFEVAAGVLFAVGFVKFKDVQSEDSDPRPVYSHPILQKNPLLSREIEVMVEC